MSPDAWGEDRKGRMGYISLSPDAWEKAVRVGGNEILACYLMHGERQGGGIRDISMLPDAW